MQTSHQLVMQTYLYGSIGFIGLLLKFLDHFIADTNGIFIIIDARITEELYQGGIQLVLVATHSLRLRMKLLIVRMRYALNIRLGRQIIHII
ncbi:MAG: hypothetical protein AAF808_16245, partial [Cyanobacteria bacterium P01_D01_bin.2]